MNLNNSSAILELNKYQTFKFDNKNFDDWKKDLRSKNQEAKEEQEQEDKIDNEIEKEVLRELEIEEQETNIQIEKQKQEEEQKIQKNTETLIAAAASTGVNLASALDTTDKSEKKLTRFNNDSIIESRKKAKKVMAISAAQKKRA